MDRLQPVDFERTLPQRRARLTWLVWVVSGLFHSTVLLGLAHWGVHFGMQGDGFAGRGHSVLQAEFLPGDATNLSQVTEATTGSVIEVEIPERIDEPKRPPEPAAREEFTRVEQPIETVDSRIDPAFRKPVEITHVTTTPEPPTKQELRPQPAEPPLTTERAAWALERNTVFKPAPGRGRGAGDGESGPESTRFFGIPTPATKLAFVIDCSSSMSRHQLFRQACAELKASLRSLTTAAQVQVICFNNEIQLAPALDRKQLLFKNTTSQQQLVASFLAGIIPDGGTDRLQALRTALRLKPDAIYFLSDADGPLYAADLNLIERENRHRTRIHVVEFGHGPLLNSDNFLMRMARENDGAYRYCDVEPK